MSATDPSLILKNHEGNRFFLTTTGNHGKFILDFTTEMGRRSLGTPLADNDDYYPIRPDDQYHRRARTRGFGRFSSHDQRDIAEYIRAKSIWDTQCEQVINFLRAALEELVRTQVETRVKDPWRGNRPCIRQVIAVLGQLYGDWSDLKGQRNYNEIAIIEVFTSLENVQSGLAKLDALKLEREGWVNDPAPYGDRYYKSWLLQRMRQWDILVILRSSLILDDTLTFAECRKRLQITIADKAEQKDEAVQRQRQITAHADKSGHYGIDSSMTTFSTNMAGATGSMSESIGGGARSTTATKSRTSLSANKVVGDTGFTCYNCGMPDHAANDCRELWCSKCGSNFVFLGCQGYHNFLDCPIWYRKRANDDVEEQLQQRPRMMQQQHIPQQRNRAKQWGQLQQHQQQQQFQPPGQVQQQHRSPTQPQSGSLPSTPPRSRFAGHVAADNNPVSHDALEVVGLQNMSQEEQAGAQQYTQPWEHANSDM